MSAPVRVARYSDGRAYFWGAECRVCEYTWAFSEDWYQVMSQAHTHALRHPHITACAVEACVIRQVCYAGASGVLSMCRASK